MNLEISTWKIQAHIGGAEVRKAYLLKMAIPVLAP